MLENDYFSIIHNYVHNVYNYARLAKIDAVRAYMSQDYYWIRRRKSMHSHITSKLTSNTNVRGWGFNLKWMFFTQENWKTKTKLWLLFWTYHLIISTANLA